MNRKCKYKNRLRKLITQLETNICAVLKQNKMKETFVKTNFNVTAFQAQRILFDDSDLVSMEVRCRIQDQIMETILLFTFSKFNDLLRFSGSCGEKLQLLVADKLWSNEEQPYCIDIKHANLIFTTCAIDISYLIEDDNSCFSAEEVMPISFLQQAKNLRVNIKDFNDVQLQKDTLLNNALQEVATAYRYYLGLMELNLNENAAREKAGLANEKLFKMAYHAAHHGK